MRRRKFISTTGAVAGLAVITQCSQGKQPMEDCEEQTKGVTEPLAKSMTTGQVMKLLDMKVVQYMQQTNNCAQSTFLALSEVFGLEGKVDLKALTVIPGIAERGETCGTVVASLMAIGLVFGSDRPGSRSDYDKALEPANVFYDRFQEQAGHTKCKQILENKFGRTFDLQKREDLKAYQENDGPTYCTTIVQKAVRIAAKLIIDKI